MIQISKELLSEILGYKDEDYVIVATEKDIFLDKNYLHYEYQHPYCTPETYTTIKDKINIYELAHKCKEWALGKKCYINSIYNEFWWDKIEKKYFADIPNKNKSFYADTEVEAIIEACEWILKELRK